MKKAPNEKDKYQMIEAAIQELADQGPIYDTGERRWSRKTETYRIVWAAVPPKEKRS
jgi:hypothetical protein